MLRRRVIEKHSLRFRPEFVHAEDYRFFSELAEFGTMSNLPTVGYRYRIYGEQVSAVHRQAQRAMHLRIAREHAERLGSRPLGDRRLSNLLWPAAVDFSEPLPRRIGRSLASSTPSAVAAVLREPGVETARFAGRKVVESLARARVSPRRSDTTVR